MANSLATWYSDPVKNLLLIATEFPPGPGGIGTHAYHMAVQLSSHGWQVTIVSPQEHINEAAIDNFTAQSHPFILRRVRDRGPQKLVSMMQLASRATAEADLILASGLLALWVGALIARKKPLAAVVHGREIRYGGVLQQVITRLALEKATCIIPVSMYTASQIKEADIHPQCMKVIPNGADANTYYPSDSAHQTIHLLTVGTLSHRKGQDVVVEALPTLIDDFPDPHYHMVGLPTRAEEILTLAVHLGVEDHITIHGMVPNLLPMYQQCAVFVLTSRHTSDDFEGYGIAVLEAALCAKPAIVTAESGLAEAVEHGVTGLVIPPDDPRAFAEAARHLLSNHTLRESIGHAARERALRKGTWQARIAQYDRLLSKLIAP